jgi:hypothetical protein
MTLPDVVLTHGSHETPEVGMCAMEFAWLPNEEQRLAVGHAQAAGQTPAFARAAIPAGVAGAEASKRLGETKVEPIWSRNRTESGSDAVR